ncbi:hypothetical protein JNUCC0626_24045 [Lentzea sp. JNUCC 0626]|uniref:hypothetical protein n=1 Tax=Lentzea sp. JNUCC 0626 TaxID=3367513 RepID=UPI0037485285
MNDVNEERAKPGGHSAPLRASGGVVGAGVGLLAAAVLKHPELAAVLAAATPAASEEGLARLRLLAQRWHDRIERATGFVLAQTGWSESELTHLYLADEQSFNMATDYLRAAAASPDEEWVRSLSHAFVRGLLATDEDRKATYSRVVSTLAGLDPIDALVIRTMHSRASSRQGWHTRDSGGKPRENVLTEAVRNTDEIIDSIVARLSTMGLVTNGSGGSGLSWDSSLRITSYGSLCIEAMTVIGDAVEAEERPNSES